MRGTNHPSIVKLLQFFESDEHYFLVLERMFSLNHLFIELMLHLYQFWRAESYFTKLSSSHISVKILLDTSSRRLLKVFVTFTRSGELFTGS